MSFTRRNLPHISQLEAPYFITYRQKGTWPMDGKVLKEGVLCQPEIAKVILDSWLDLAKERIHLEAVCIMPDHVHAVFILNKDEVISKLMYSHKRFTGARINQILNRQGALWQDESFDKILRNGTLSNAIEYVLMNPVKAGLAADWREWPYIYLPEASRQFLGADFQGPT